MTATQSQDSAPAAPAARGEAPPVAGVTPRWVSLVLVLSGSGLWFLAFSGTDWSLLPFLLGSLVWFIVGCLWIAGGFRILCAIIARRPRVKHVWYQLFFIPCSFSLLSCLIVRDVPRRVGLSVSRAALDELVRQVQANPSGPHADRRVGIYFARRIRVTPNGVEFMSGAEYLGHGFGYWPNGVVEREHEISKRIDGNWWYWEND